MEEMFKNPLLDNFFVLRRNETESKILKQNNMLTSVYEVKESLFKFIEQLTVDNEIKKELVEYFEKIENTISEENDLLNNNFYKIGFIDGTKIAVEVKKGLDKWTNWYKK